MKLSLVIPIYNEARHLKNFLDKLDAFDFGIETEFVIVDDCSRDESWKIVSDFSFRHAVKLFRQEPNQGKGAALRKGFEAAQGDFIVVQDADFEYDLKDIPPLLQPLLEDRADVVYGSRFRQGNNQVHRTFHYLVNRFLTLMSNLMSGLYLSDMETCYKLFRADVIQNIRLESNRFGFEPEVTAKIARLKVRVLEFPISYFPRSYLEGKKINWKDGVAALWHLIKYNLIQTRSEEIFLSGMPEKYLLHRE